MKRTAITLTLISALLMLAVVGTPSVHAAEDSWVSKAPMQQPRNCRVAVVNGRIYAIGGDNLATNEEYDPANDTWTFKATMPTPRLRFGIAVCQNKIYCIGGQNGTGVTGVNEVYNPATDTWETMASMPTPRSGLQANVVNGKIYLIGGVANDYALTLNEVYDPKTDSWATKAPMPVINFTFLGTSDYASAVVGNKIYVVGGWSVGGQWPVRGVTFNLNRIYDAENDSWSLGAPAPSPAICASAGATTGVFAPERIYVFGADTGWPLWMIGLRGFTAQSYDPKTDSWTVCTSMPTERVDASVAVVSDELYVIGGYTIEKGVSSFFPSTAASAVNEEYTPFGYGSVPPAVAIISPEKETYTSSNVSLTFTVNKPAVWMGFSLDGQETVTITDNTSIAGLANGLHNVTVYANDTFGNTGASKTIPFNIDQPEPFPATLVAIGVVSAAVIGIGLLVYIKKRKH
jgi:N-acetylneuraminic acid mutarotase